MHLNWEMTNPSVGGLGQSPYHKNGCGLAQLRTVTQQRWSAFDWRKQPASAHKCFLLKWLKMAYARRARRVAIAVKATLSATSLAFSNTSSEASASATSVIERTKWKGHPWSGWGNWTEVRG
jgi:hypothetical protein